MSIKRAAPQAPPIPDELLDWLDFLFPDKCPKPTHSGREIWMAVGRRDVVARLRMERDRQLADSKKDKSNTTK